MPRFPFLAGLLVILVTLGACAAVLYPPVTGSAAGGPGTTMARLVLHQFSRFNISDPVTVLVAIAWGTALLALLFHPDQKSLGMGLAILVLSLYSFWIDSPSVIRFPDASTAVTGLVVGIICSILLFAGGPYPRGIRAHGWAFALGVATLALVTLFILKTHQRAGQPADIGLPIAFVTYAQGHTAWSPRMLAFTACTWGLGAAGASILITIALQGPRAVFRSA